MREEAKEWSTRALRGSVGSPAGGTASVQSDLGYEADNPDNHDSVNSSDSIQTGMNSNGKRKRNDLNRLNMSQNSEMHSPELQRVSQSGGLQSQDLKKERNRLHAKLTRDRKKLFTSKMAEMITYYQQQNKKRREVLVENGRRDHWQGQSEFAQESHCLR